MPRCCSATMTPTGEGGRAAAEEEEEVEVEGAAAARSPRSSPCSTWTCTTARTSPSSAYRTARQRVACRGVSRCCCTVMGAAAENTGSSMTSLSVQPSPPLWASTSVTTRIRCLGIWASWKQIACVDAAAGAPASGKGLRAVASACTMHVLQLHDASGSPPCVYDRARHCDPAVACAPAGLAMPSAQAEYAWVSCRHRCLGSQLQWKSTCQHSRYYPSRLTQPQPPSPACALPPGQHVAHGRLPAV
eukprot:1160517-Pelagomonas_calceolata.AAC.12